MSPPCSSTLSTACHPDGQRSRTYFGRPRTPVKCLMTMFALEDITVGGEDANEGHRPVAADGAQP
jgi:hypothetical protein